MRCSLPSTDRSIVLRSTPLAGILIAALTILGCGGGGGGGATGGNGGAAGGKSGSGGNNAKGGAAGGNATSTGGAAGGSVTNTGGTAGGAAGQTGSGGAAGEAGNGGGVAGAGGTAGTAGGTGTGGAAGGGATCTEGTSCTTSGGVTGVCTSGTCAGCTSTSACTASTAYGAGYVCLLGSGNCVQGTCANNGDCNGKICGSTHTCAACSQTSDCTTAYGTGYVCQSSSGTCVQGNCTTNADCANGGICDSSATCQTCASGAAGDTACVGAYGTGYICVSGGCVMGTCHTGTDCTTAGQICNASHTCASCTGDTGCQASYTDGRICVGGACVVGNCHDASTCSNGKICTNNSCVACASDNQCASGQICLAGACITGNCRAAADCNDPAKVCASNKCGACAATSDCTTAYGANHVCSNGACVMGNCLTTADCAAGGLLCGSQTAFTCGACSSDTDCTTAYGAGHICNGGACIPGTCHNSNGCNAGQVCDLGTHTCGGCGSGSAGDTACRNDTKYGATYLCEANACVVGNCHVATDCNATQICSGLTCGTCSSDADCTNAYGINHVCAGGACVSGNCNSSAECGGNQLCINHACTACTAGTVGDAQCTADTTYGPMHICLSGQCLAGNCHDTSSECTGGQICGLSAAHTCGSCGSGTDGDAACRNDTTYGSGDICLSGGCLQGDCHDTSADCTAGQVCGVSSAHTCGSCAADGDCTGDARYGADDICYQGLCGAGNCHANSSDCTGTNAGLICGVTAANTCGGCTSDSQCKSDTFYGSNDICDTTTGQCVSAACSPNSAACSANASDVCCGGSCTAGTCCTDTDCGAFGTACVNHTCSSCNAESGNKWYVDPVNGNDLTATGSDMSGTSVAPGCAFKTITRAMQAMPPTPPVGTQIILVGSAGSTTGLSSGDTLPLILPANTTLTTAGGPITITLKTTSTSNAAGFSLNNNGSAIAGGTGAPLVLDGGSQTSGIAILVSPGTSTNTASISNLTIQNTGGDGIRVTAGTLTVGAGVVVNGSKNDGIRITGGAANIDNPSGAQTLFANNAQHGIEVSGLGSVNVNGTPGSPIPSNSGTIVTMGNTTAGIRINQTPGATGLVTNTINGLVSWANINYGMRLYGGSLVKVRNSVLLASGSYGVIIGSSGTTSAGYDLSKLDLGTAGDPGLNWLQTPLGALGTNAGGGICVSLTARTGTALTEMLSAEGNEMVSTGNAQVDCSASTATITTTTTTCGSRRSVGVNLPTGSTTTVDFAGCQ